MENPYGQSQYTQVGRPEGQPQLPNQYYHQVVESQNQDNQQAPIPTSSYQSYPMQSAPSNNLQPVTQQEPAVGSRQFSYAPDGHVPYAASSMNFGGDNMAATFVPQEGFISPSVNQQEVPSSYSSMPGKGDPANSHHHVHTSITDVGRPVLTEQTQYMFENQSLHTTTDLRDQPLEFAPRLSHDIDPEIRSSYPDSAGPVRGMSSVGPLPAVQPWVPPAAPGVSYPSLPPVFPSASQHDASIGLSSVPGQPASLSGRGPGPSFHPTVVSPTAPLSLGAITAVNPVVGMQLDTFGPSMGAERPKKAPMPNWLREEVIKKRDAIASSAPDLKEVSPSVEDESSDKPVRKGDQADSKSVDTSRSTEEDDDDDEDYVEAARTAAINQEIKRILTEVLLKVTDELFDEIASKVLREDDGTAKVDDDHHDPDLKVSAPSPAVSTAKASAKVLIPVKAKERESRAVHENSSSGSPGDILGLGNYASEDEDETQSSIIPDRRNDQGPGDTSGVDENGHSHEDPHRSLVNARADHCDTDSAGDPSDHGVVSGNPSDHRMGGGLNSNGLNLSVANKTEDTSGKLAVSTADLDSEEREKSFKGNTQGRDGRRRDRHESKRSSSSKDSVKEIESGKLREKEKVETNRGRRDDGHQKKDKTEDDNSSRDRCKEHGSKDRGKIKETDYRKKSPDRQPKEKKKEIERTRKASDKDDSRRRRERRVDEKVERSRRNHASDSGRHKRSRSPSVGRGRNSKDNSVSRTDDSSEEASQDSRRKENSRKLNLPPSPVRSKRRHVLRSPSSEHTQGRHSPFSSLDSSREKRKRSRSRSPRRRR